jgi:hypothetical protein
MTGRSKIAEPVAAVLWLVRASPAWTSASIVTAMLPSVLRVPLIVPDPIVDPRTVVVQFGNCVSETFEKLAFAHVPSRWLVTAGPVYATVPANVCSLIQLSLAFFL